MDSVEWQVLRFLAQHKLVDCMVTTGGAIEEDLMKCLAPHYTGTADVAESVGVPGAGFSMDGRSLRLKGLNRIGNMIVPNDNYCRFEEWFQPLLDEMLTEQVDQVCASVAIPRQLVCVCTCMRTCVSLPS